MYKEYKVIYVAESGLSTIFLGAAGLPLKKIELEMNHAATQGWNLAFQVLEQKRYLLFWKREALVITFGR